MVFDSESWINEAGVVNTSFDVCYHSDEKLQFEITKALDSLQPYGFEFFDLTFSEYDYWLLSHLSAQVAQTVNVYSDLDTLRQKAEQFLQSFALDARESYLASDLANLIVKLARNTVAASGYDDAQIALVSYLDSFDYFPFWHVDKTHSEILENAPEQDSKSRNVFIFSLKGETTLYQQADTNLRQEFNKIANETSYVYGYSYLDYVKGEGLDKMFKIQNAVSAQYGQGSVHFSGYKHGTVHAVPDTYNRVIMLISPNDHHVMRKFSAYMTEQNKKIAEYFT